ncbi:2-C-methyl-D-erythritol 4-phosphate cytidylyltransferase [Enterococcus gallinarum]|uniref:IspD/TarI family cytidylyltransferase n=1 Tax=Enterococcus gallinarum TaxID=1353 RepID=UPI00288D1F25|nr:2-C-methyl-D-erythritol 4-phosphate cytidylyltransferase [Enterococcus gallinarum]MDT2681916.1 2-C-methyl-D-erythritol 4-phosphate cytidylyltransferase [Enterococcus gallinarum]
MIYAHIMAGGTGKRMGNTPLPKQFLNLGNKPIIIHTVEKFLLNDEFSLIIVSTPEIWIEYTKEIFEKYGIADERLEIISGGRERNDTLVKAIEFIEKNKGLNNDDVIIAHDAVRPFISKRIIDENINALKKYNAVDTIVSAYDTIVKSNGDEIIDIPIRDFMYHGQTPQSFNIQKFKKCFEKLSDEEKKSLSDSCKIMLLGGEKVGVVMGEHSNIKITTQYDLKIANAIIERAHSVS